MQRDHGPNTLERIRNKLSPKTLVRLGREALHLIHSPKEVEPSTLDTSSPAKIPSQPKEEQSPRPAVGPIEGEFHKIENPTSKHWEGFATHMDPPPAPSEVTIPNPIPRAPHLVEAAKYGLPPEIPSTPPEIEAWHQAVEASNRIKAKKQEKLFALKSPKPADDKELINT